MGVIGSSIAHYTVLSELGRGGMGVVYLAEDTRLGRKVALKSLPVDFARDPIRRKRFENEARAAAALNHPGIASVFQLEEVGDDLYIVFEYVEGSDLRSVLRAGTLSLHQLTAIGAGIAQALAAAHAKNIVHRDLKPENIRLTESGAPKVLDFGLARMEMSALSEATASIALTQAGTIVGTVGYMSPEQLECQDLDFRSDIFSFGVMLYEMASGTHPFQGGSSASTIANIMAKEPPPLTAANPITPPELERIVRKCLRKKREERYQSTGDLALDLQALVAASSAVQWTAPPLTSRPATETQRSTDEVVHATHADEKITSVLSGPGTGLPTHGPLAWFNQHPQRWWLWHQIYMIFFATPVMIFIQWQIHGWLPDDLFSANLAYLVVTLPLGVAAILRGYQMILFAFLAQRPEVFLKTVRPVLLVNMSFTGVPLALIALQSVLFGMSAHTQSASFFIFIGISGLVLEFLIEPNMNRMAFPEAMREPVAEELKHPNKKLEVMGMLQGIITVVFLAPFFGPIRVLDIDLNPTPHDALIGFLLMLAFFSVLASAAFTVLWFLKRFETLRPFQRAFPLFFAFALAAYAMWIYFITATNKGSFGVILNLAIAPAFLYLPFYQRKLAREILGPDAELGELSTTKFNDHQKAAMMQTFSMICTAAIIFFLRDVFAKSIQNQALAPGSMRQEVIPGETNVMLAFALFLLLSIFIHFGLAYAFFQRDLKIIHFFHKWYWLFFIFDLPVLAFINTIVSSPLLVKNGETNLFFLMLTLILAMLGFFTFIKYQRKFTGRILESGSNSAA